MRPQRQRILPFDVDRAASADSRVGRVHRDGSITFRGETYPTIKDLPEACLAIRLDGETYRQWKRLYRVIAPSTAAPRRRPVWFAEE